MTSSRNYWTHTGPKFYKWRFLLNIKHIHLKFIKIAFHRQTHYKCHIHMHKDIYTGHFSTMVRVNTRTDKPFNDPHKRKATFSIHAVHRTKHLTIQNDFRRKIVLFCFPVTHSSNRMGENGNTTKLYLYLKHIGEENFWLKTKSKTTYSQCVQCTRTRSKDSLPTHESRI